MTLWKIRIAVPDDPASQGALNSALAGQPVSGVRVMPGRASAPTARRLRSKAFFPHAASTLTSASHGLTYPSTSGRIARQKCHMGRFSNWRLLPKPRRSR